MGQNGAGKTTTINIFLGLLEPASGEALSRQLSAWLTSVRMQLSMNVLAHTDLDSHMHFLDATARFHERMRLEMYPKIFGEVRADEMTSKTLRSIEGTRG